MFRDGDLVFLTTPGGDDTVTLCPAGANDPIGGGGVSHFGWKIANKADLDDCRETNRARWRQGAEPWRARAGTSISVLRGSRRLRHRAMKHAGANALDALELILTQLRAIDGLKEKSRGTFYRKSKAFLHFHEDPAGFFADLKKGADFVRLPVNNRAEIAALIREAKRALAD
jgi:hypothetical protein